MTNKTTVRGFSRRNFRSNVLGSRVFADVPETLAPPPDEEGFTHETHEQLHDTTRSAFKASHDDQSNALDNSLSAASIMEVVSEVTFRGHPTPAPFLVSYSQVSTSQDVTAADNFENSECSLTETQTQTQTQAQISEISEEEPTTSTPLRRNSDERSSCNIANRHGRKEEVSPSGFESPDGGMPMLDLLGGADDFGGLPGLDLGLDNEAEAMINATQSQQYVGRENCATEGYGNSGGRGEEEERMFSQMSSDGLSQMGPTQREDVERQMSKLTKDDILDAVQLLSSRAAQDWTMREWKDKVCENLGIDALVGEHKAYFKKCLEEIMSKFVDDVPYPASDDESMLADTDSEVEESSPTRKGRAAAKDSLPTAKTALDLEREIVDKHEAGMNEREQEIHDILHPAEKDIEITVASAHVRKVSKAHSNAIAANTLGDIFAQALDGKDWLNKQRAHSANMRKCLRKFIDKIRGEKIKKTVDDGLGEIREITVPSDSALLAPCVLPFLNQKDDRVEREIAANVILDEDQAEVEVMVDINTDVHTDGQTHVNSSDGAKQVSSDVVFFSDSDDGDDDGDDDGEESSGDIGDDEALDSPSYGPEATSFPDPPSASVERDVSRAASSMRGPLMPFKNANPLGLKKRSSEGGRWGRVKSSLAQRANQQANLRAMKKWHLVNDDDEEVEEVEDEEGEHGTGTDTGGGTSANIDDHHVASSSDLPVDDTVTCEEYVLTGANTGVRDADDSFDDEASGDERLRGDELQDPELELKKILQAHAYVRSIIIMLSERRRREALEAERESRRLAAEEDVRKAEAAAAQSAKEEVKKT